MLVMTAAGCETVDEQSWSPWCDYRGYCRLMLTLQVKSKPSAAEVYVGDELMGVTPCSFVLKANPVITGRKCRTGFPDNDKEDYIFRDTKFESRTTCSLRLTKKGYEPLSKTLVIEDLFPPADVKHGEEYKKIVAVTFAWE